MSVCCLTVRASGPVFAARANGQSEQLALQTVKLLDALIVCVHVCDTCLIVLQTRLHVSGLPSPFYCCVYWIEVGACIGACISPFNCFACPLLPTYAAPRCEVKLEGRV